MTGAGEFSGTITSGRFRLVGALAGGAASRVHEARHDRLAGRFAVKLLGDVEPRALQRAAQQASSLHHPGIVKVVDYGVALGQSCIVMELIEGRSLAAMLASSGALAPDAVARIVDSVALGLQAAHRQGLAHGHLAPERVLVLAPGAEETSGGERTKILGFGLGRDLPRRTSGARPAGLTPYTAPEQPAGDATPLGDQYALGAMAYEMLTGVAPEAAGPRRPARSIREYDPTINVVIDEVVQRALSRDPGSRWADVYTFSKHLREATDSEGALEERTRLAPLPLTVSRPPRLATPTPIELPPVVASIDVDLRTPPPQRLELPLQGEVSMNPPFNNPPSGRPPAGRPPAGRPPVSRPPEAFRNQSQFAGPSASPRAPSRGPAPTHHPIRPTPTFSFTDDPEPGPLYKPRRRGRSGGGLGLAFLVIVAAAGGYLTVQTHAWQDVEPLVARAKALVRSVRAMAPGASAAPPAPSSAPPAPGETSPTANEQASAGAHASAREGAPTIRPEVVLIAPPTAAPSRRAAQRAAEDGARGSRAHRRHERAPRTASGRAPKPLSDEAAAEEALLGAPSGGR